jgi:hypothetical protein
MEFGFLNLCQKGLNMVARDLLINHKFIEEIDGLEVEVKTSPRHEDGRIYFDGVDSNGTWVTYDYPENQEIIIERM